MPRLKDEQETPLVRHGSWDYGLSLPLRRSLSAVPRTAWRRPPQRRKALGALQQAAQVTGDARDVSLEQGPLQQWDVAA